MPRGDGCLIASTTVKMAAFLCVPQRHCPCLPSTFLHTARPTRRRLRPGSSAGHATRICALDLSGKWIKDQENSDLNAYSDMLSLLGLSGIRKTGALKLINALVIEQAQTEPQFTVRYIVSRVQFLRSVEHFTLGRSVDMPRRDGQAGTQSATITQNDKRVQTVITWGPPNPGDYQQDQVQCCFIVHHIELCNLPCAVILTETYSQVSGALVTEAVVEAQGQKLRCKQV